MTGFQSAINQPPAHLKYTRGSYKDSSELGQIHDHRAAFEHILEAFIADPEIPQVPNKESIQYACHRVVQGGRFEEDQLITKDTFEKINKLSDLAPLYACLSSIEGNSAHYLPLPSDIMPPR